jgi:hypothetical protein
MHLPPLITIRERNWLSMRRISERDFRRTELTICSQSSA